MCAFEAFSSNLQAKPLLGVTGWSHRKILTKMSAIEAFLGLKLGLNLGLNMGQRLKLGLNLELEMGLGLNLGLKSGL